MPFIAIDVMQWIVIVGLPVVAVIVAVIVLISLADRHRPEDARKHGHRGLRP